MRHRGNREAVALEYGQNRAPVVVAKGSDELAELILEEARKQGFTLLKTGNFLPYWAGSNLSRKYPKSSTQLLLLFCPGPIG